MMVCFHCGQGLRDWKVHDQPWKEHARWSPTCGFVLLSKGGEFVAEELGLQTIYARRSEVSIYQIKNKDKARNLICNYFLGGI